MQTDFWPPYLYGTVSGVIISILTVATINLFKTSYKTIVNRIIRYYNRYDIDIEGEWIGIPHADDYEDPQYQETISIRRMGENITGTVRTTQGKYTGRIYVLEGKFRNLTLMATYKSKDGKNLECGSYCVALTDIGNTFKGYVTYCPDDHREIKTTDYILQRKQ